MDPKDGQEAQDVGDAIIEGLSEEVPAVVDPKDGQEVHTTSSY